MEKKDTCKPDYLYLCDSVRKIADHKCNGHGCMIFDQCTHTRDKEYAILSDDRRFEYYCETDKDGQILKEYYFEV